MQLLGPLCQGVCEPGGEWADFLSVWTIPRRGGGEELEFLLHGLTDAIFGHVIMAFQALSASYEPPFGCVQGA